DVLTVSGNDASRIFDVIGGADESTRIHVAISGLTLSHGRELEGAGIINSFCSDLNLEAVKLLSNQTSSLSNAASPRGGPANTGAGANLILFAATLMNNTADGSSGLGSLGGAIFSDGQSVSLAGGNITGNQALAGFGSNGFGGEALGGAICVSEGDLSVDAV